MDSKTQFDHLYRDLAVHEIGETAIQMLKEFVDIVVEEQLHPNSKQYREMERDMLLRIGREIGRLEAGQ